MNVIDRLRCESKIFLFDCEMELRGVPRARRRECREDMRSNLHDAVAEQGCSLALANFGGVQEHAAAVGEPYQRRPLWSIGAFWGALTFAVATFVYLLCGIAFMEAVRASGVEGRPVTAESVFPWFSRMEAEVYPDHRGFSLSFRMPWSILVLGVAVGLLAARPWRAWAGKEQTFALPKNG